MTKHAQRIAGQDGTRLIDVADTALADDDAYAGSENLKSIRRHDVFIITDGIPAGARALTSVADAVGLRILLTRVRRARAVVRIVGHAIRIDVDDAALVGGHTDTKLSVAADASRDATPKVQ
jgi:hypothetical protein